MSLNVCPTGHLICPYNKSHIIRAERMQFHLTKCLPNTGSKPFVVCPFNSTHLIPATEINNHKANLCPDRNKLDTFLYEIESTKPLFPVTKIEVECEENWDDAVEHTYNPEEILNERRLLVLKQVAPPAERKRFHAEQRKKFQTLTDEPISVAKDTKLRLPNTKPITQDVSKKNPVVKKETPQIQDKIEPIINEMKNMSVVEKKKTDEFELVVGKKKNKKTNAKLSANQKETGKTNAAQSKKTETKKDKKPIVSNGKNTDENLKVSLEVPVNVASNESFSEEPKEDEFIVVTKRKNKTRKH